MEFSTAMLINKDDAIIVDAEAAVFSFFHLIPQQFVSDYKF